ncbi:MAG: hypothetical protein ACLS4Z_02795 [Christensenellaceae bacterium]
MNKTEAGMQLSDYEVAEDMLIDGLKIVQDTRLYRFTSDSVLLSRFARAKAGDKVADFCAGSGIVAFHFTRSIVRLRDWILRCLKCRGSCPSFP